MTNPMKILGLALLAMLLSSCDETGSLSLDKIDSDKSGKRLYFFDDSKCVLGINNMKDIQGIGRVTKTGSQYQVDLMDAQGQRHEISTQLGQCIVVTRERVEVKNISQSDIQKMVTANDFSELFKL